MCAVPSCSLGRARFWLDVGFPLCFSPGEERKELRGYERTGGNRPRRVRSGKPENFAPMDGCGAGGEALLFVSLFLTSQNFCDTRIFLF